MFPLLSADIIPKIKPIRIAIRIAENANIKVFGRVSPMIAETFLPWFTKDVLRYGYLKFIVDFLKSNNSIPV